MKPRLCKVENFGSYGHAEIDFSDLGLTLISGSTGSGKSTIADFVAYTCFGVTSKQGNADDVRAWGCDEPTKVELEVELPDGDITVVRIRGKQTQNDIYWLEAGDPENPKRGKDATDTQRLLEQRLGVDAELFLLGSYFSQFSLTDAFFTARPKDRRETLERITDLSLPILLAERASEARKVAKKELEALESSLTKEQGRQEQVLSQIQNSVRASEAWEVEHDRALIVAQARLATFEDEKTAKLEKAAEELEALSARVTADEEFTAKAEQIKEKQAALGVTRTRLQQTTTAAAELKAKLSVAAREYDKQERLPDTCPECQRPGAAPNKEQHLAKLKKGIGMFSVALKAETYRISVLEKELAAEASLQSELDQVRRAQAENQRLKDRIEAEEKALIALDESENPYLSRLEQLKGTKNPYIAQIEDAKKARDALAGTVKGLEQQVAEKAHRVTSLSSIYDLSFALRGEMLQNAVAQLERDTNGNLSEYFDGVFSVAFALEGADKLTVTVNREGREVSYFQCSGGERRQITLAFWRALSKRAWECSGTSTSLIILDEAFSGLDETLKGSAFRMLEDLSEEYESILVIDHSPSFQLNFSNVIYVTKQGEQSFIESGAVSQEAA